MFRTSSGSRLRFQPFFLLIFLTLLATAGCRDGLDFRIVEVQVGNADSEEVWIMPMNTYFLAFSPDEEGGSYWIPVSGDTDLFLEFEGVEGILPLRPSDEPQLVFEVGDFAVSLEGVPVYLTLDGNGAGGWDWLSRATLEDKRNLRMIALGDEVTPDHWALLEELAIHNPLIQVDADDNGLVLDLLALFDPVFLPINDLGLIAENLQLLAQEPELRILAVDDPETADLRFLKELPRVETLLLTDWDPDETGSLPDSISGLKSIVLGGWDGEDLGTLGRQPGLEELSLVGCDGDDLSNLDRISDFPDLRLLAFRNCEVADLAPLTQLQNLRWLGLPDEITQTRLEQIVLALPDLEVLELMEADEVTDLTPLRELKKLKGLMLGTTAPPDPLFEMSQLEYLALTLDSGEESPYGEHILPRLRAALPETIITRVDPFCLGSGYILLLFPMVALGWFISGRRRRAKDSGPGHG